MSSTFNMFDAMRLAGKTCLASLPGWSTEPLAAAQQYTDALFRSLGADPRSEALQVVYHGVYSDVLLAGMWAASGYPTVVLGHRTAAELMATKIRPAEATEFVRSPWPAWAIRVPTPILTVEDEGVHHDAGLILVGCVQGSEQNQLSPEPHWWYKLFATSPRPSMNFPDEVRGLMANISLWAFNVPTSYLANEDHSSDEAYMRWDTHPTSSSDVRSELLARSLILGCSLYLSGDPRERERQAANFGATVNVKPSKARPGDVLPPYTSYELQSAIRINLHQAMRDFVAQGGKAPTVQTLVAGHWKRQAHGPAHSLRRLQHIQPYWRGDKDAPVAERVK